MQTSDRFQATPAGRAHHNTEFPRSSGRFTSVSLPELLSRPAPVESCSMKSDAARIRVLHVSYTDTRFAWRGMPASCMEAFSART